MKIIRLFLFLIFSLSLTSCGGGGSVSPSGGGVPIVPAPTVTLLAPQNSSEVSRSPSIQIQFSEPVLNVNSDNVSLHKGSPEGDSLPLSDITLGAGNAYTFSIAPPTVLDSQTSYYIVLSPGIISASSGVSIKTTVFSFKTGDASVPSVLMLSPLDGATNISKNPTIQVQFSKDVQNVTPTNVTLHVGSPTGDTVGIGSILLGASNTYTIRLASDLASSQTYYVVLSNGIRDKYETPLPETVFSFTTGDLSDPSASIISPLNNATNISRSPTIQL